jgi:hypothetical protein
VDAKQIVVKLAAVLVTLLETTDAGQSVAASPIYCALGMDMSTYEQIITVGTRMGWLKASSEQIGLTAKGREAAQQMAPAFA